MQICVSYQWYFRHQGKRGRAPGCYLSKTSSVKARQLDKSVRFPQGQNKHLALPSPNDFPFDDGKLSPLMESPKNPEEDDSFWKRRANIESNLKNIAGNKTPRSGEDRLERDDQVVGVPKEMPFTKQSQVGKKPRVLAPPPRLGTVKRSNLQQHTSQNNRTLQI